MRRAVALIVVAVAAYVALHRTYSPPPSPGAATRSAPSPGAQPAASSPTASAATADDDVERAIGRHARDVRVDGTGQVVRLLPDDNDGDRHQRFIVRLSGGETVLIAHNIGIAPRVEALHARDTVQFEGEYVWNDKGGVVHWTHHDPSGHHRAGFLLVHGRKYQ